jgi:hypothetical protein
MVRTRAETGRDQCDAYAHSTDRYQNFLAMLIKHRTYTSIIRSTNYTRIQCELTDSQPSKEEQECKRAKNPRNLTLRISLQLILEQPRLEDTNRIQKPRCRKKYKPRAEHNTVSFEAALRVGFGDAGWSVQDVHSRSPEEPKRA